MRSHTFRPPLESPLPPPPPRRSRHRNGGSDLGGLLVHRAITDAGDAATEGAADAADAATDAAGTATDDILSALTPEGFDADQLRAFVAESDLNPLQQQAAEALITQGEENPDQIQAIAQQLRAALGL